MSHEQGVTEANLEDVALAWFESLGYNIAFGPDISQDGPASERHDYDQVVLIDRLRTALESINPTIPRMRSTKPSGKSPAQNHPA